MLKLKRLELKDFGPIEGTKVIEYKDGLNLILAENGKGKSNSIYAIEMLLIDTYEGSYETYINHNKDGFYIALDFDADNHSYTISLECSKTKNLTTTRILKEDNEEIAKGEEAKQYLARILPPDITKYALVAKQKPLDNITTCSDAERRELFKRIKSMDYEKTIKEILQPKLDAVKESIVQKDKEIYALENYPYEEKKTEKPLPFTEKDYKVKKAEHDKLYAEKALIQEKNSKLEELQQSYDKYLSDGKSNMRRQSEKLSAIDDYKKDLAELDEKDTSLTAELSEKKKEWTEKEKRNIEQKRKESEQSKSDSKDKVESLKKQLEETNAEYASIHIVKIVKYNEAELEDARNKFSSIKFSIDNCLKNIESLKDGVCPVCGQSCTHKLSDYQKEHDSLLKELEQITHIKESLESKKSLYEKNKEQNQRDKNRKDALLKESENIESRISLLQTNIESMDRSLEEAIEQEKSNTQRLIANQEKFVQETIKSNKAMREKLRDYISKAEQEISFLKEEEKKIEEESRKKKQEIDKFSTEEYDDSALISIENELNAYDETVLYNNNVREFNERLAETIEKNKTDLKKKREEKASLQGEQFNLESAKSIMLKDFPNYVVDQSVESIEQNMNQFIEDVYYKPLNVCLRSTKTSIKLEYGTGNRKLPAYRLSGAESKLVSLSFINNFNKMLGLNLLLLDEPDSAMDDERKKDLYTILLGMTEVYEQLVIITHSRAMSDYMLANNGDCNIITL